MIRNVQIWALSIYINSNNIRKKNFFKVQRKMIEKQKDRNVIVLKLFQNVNTCWDFTCHMLIKALALKKTLSRYHDKHEIEYLRLSDTEWSQVKYLINFIKLFCVFIKRIDQFKLLTIHQMLEIYDKLFDHLDWTRLKLSRKKVSWKRVIFDDLTRSECQTSILLFKDTRFFKLFIQKNDVVIIKQKKRCISKFELKSETW